MILTLFFLSSIGGFFSGLLGVGGAVVLIPLMLAVPPLLDVGQLTMHQVAAITMIQVLAACISGWIAHRRDGFTHTKTILAIGLPMGVCALVGAIFSKVMDSRNMLIIFGCLVLFAFVILLKKTHNEDGDGSHEFRFNVPFAGAIGCCVGIISGIVGAGGGFVLIPLMVTILKMPMRIAVGSSLGIVFISALMGAVGKILSLQVEWTYLLPVIAGSIPAAQVGARISRAIPPRYVRYVLLTVVTITLINTWKNIIFG